MYSQTHGKSTPKMYQVKILQPTAKRIFDKPTQTQGDICADVVNAILSEKQIEITKHIKRISNLILREQLQKLGKQYIYSKYRCSSLAIKTDFLLENMRKMISAQLINPQIKIVGDTIKQVDLRVLQKVIEMTNESKIYKNMAKQKEMKWKQIAETVPTESYALIDTLYKRFIHLNNKQQQPFSLESRELIEQNQRLKRQLQAAKKKVQMLRNDIQGIHKDRSFMKNQKDKNKTKIDSPYQSNQYQLKQQTNHFQQSEQGPNKKSKKLKITTEFYKQLEQKKFNLQNNLEAAKEQNKRLSNNVKIMEGQLQKIKKELKEQQKEGENKSVKMQSLSNRINELQQTLQRSNQRHLSIKQQWRIQLEQQNQKLAKHQQTLLRVKQLQQQSRTLQQQLEKVQQKRKQQNDNIEAFQKMINEADGKYHFLEKSYSKQISLKEKLLKQLTEQQSQKREAQLQLSTHQRDLDALSLQLEAKESELQSIKKEKYILQQSQINLQNARKQIRQLLSQLSQLRKQFQSREKQIAQLCKRLYDKQQEIKDYQQTVTKFKKQLQNKNQQLQQLRQLSEVNSKIKTQLQSKLTQFDSLLKQLESEKDQIQKLKNQIKDLKIKKNLQTTQANQFVKKEIETLKEKYGQLEQSKVKSRRQFQSLKSANQQQKEKSKRILFQWQAKVRKLNEKIQQMEAEHNNTVSLLSKQNAQLQQSNQLFINQNTTLQRQHSSAQLQLESIRKQQTETNKHLKQKQLYAKVADKIVLDLCSNLEQSQNKVKQIEKQSAKDVLLERQNAKKIQNQVNRLNKQIGSQNQQIQNIGDKLKEQQSKNISLQRELQQVKQKLLKAQHLSNKSNILQQQRQDQELGSKISQKRQQKNEFSYIREDSKYVSIEETLKAQIQELKNKLNQTQEQLIDNQSQLKKAQQQSGLFQRKLIHQKQESERVRQHHQYQLNKLRQQNQTLQYLYQKKEIEDKNNKSLQSEEIKDKIQTLEKDVNDKARVISELLQQLQEYKNKQKEQTNKELQQFKQIKDKEAQIDRQGQIIKDFESAKQQLTTKKEKNIKLLQQLQAQQRQNEWQKGEILRLKEHALQKYTLLQSLNAEYTKIDSNLKDQHTKVLLLQFEISKKEKKISELEEQKLLEFKKTTEFGQEIQKKDVKMLDLQRQLAKNSQALQLYKQQKNKNVSLNVQLKTTKQQLQQQIKEGNQMKELKPLRNKLKEVEKENEQIRVALERLKLENYNYQATLKKLNVDFEICSQNMKEIIIKHETETKRLNSQIMTAIQSENAAKQRNKDLQALNEQLATKITQLQGTLQRKDKEITSQKQTMAKLQKANQVLNKADDRARLQKKIADYQQQIDDLNHQIDVLNTTLQEMNQMNRQAQQGQKSKPQNKIKLDKTNEFQFLRQMEEKDQNIQELYRQLSKKSSQIETLTQQIAQIKQQNQFFSSQLQKHKEQHQKLSLTLSLRQNELSTIKESYQLKLSEQLQYIQETKQQLTKSLQKIKSLSAANRLNAGKSDLSTQLLFQNDILQYQFQHKQFLRKTIEQHMRCTIIKSRLIYRFDPLNKINFHRYIDLKENIVLIVKISNGHYIAGYSQGKFEAQKQSNRTGIIMSLSKRQVFYLAQSNKRAISYDDYYIIFGNSQIRLRSQEQVVFSNFGISNSYYNSRGKKVSDFLGGKANEREIQIQGYEIYQLQMDMD